MQIELISQPSIKISVPESKSGQAQLPVVSPLLDILRQVNLFGDLHLPRHEETHHCGKRHI